MTRRRSQGFTLVEMLVVVAIIAILSGLLISVSSRPVGANARTTSDLVVSTINFAKLRASATRRVHTVQVTPNQLVIYACTTTGLVCDAPPGDLIQQVKIANGVVVADTAMLLYPSGSSPITGPNSALDDAISVRPDGQASRRTIFITDTRDPWRVLVYPVTGGAYARQGW